MQCEKVIFITGLYIFTFFISRFEVIFRPKRPYLYDLDYFLHPCLFFCVHAFLLPPRYDDLRVYILSYSLYSLNPQWIVLR